jgi:large subunit ribosomal protein L12
MEYIYAGMLLHAIGKEIKEDSIKKVLEAAGAKVDEARIKALVTALEQVDINEAIEKTAFTAATPIAASNTETTETKKEENKEEDTEKAAEEASSGLGALF